jgi:hypothetical protein
MPFDPTGLCQAFAHKNPKPPGSAAITIGDEMTNAANNEKVWAQGYMDGMQGRAEDIGAAPPQMAGSYKAGFKQGAHERNEATARDPAKLSPREDLAVTAEFSAYEEALKTNLELAAQMVSTRQRLNDEAVLIIDAMGLALDSKKETLEKLRDFKSTVIREVSEVTAALSRLKELTSDKAMKEQTAQLKEYLLVCEKFSQLKASGAFAEISHAAATLAFK